ncbi:MAG: PKD domain-containing protein [Roseburia sp.]|nr:PKD domain-containing protein [Anaeroplasma bactoclasticum]MCM1195993.1 PKD domain-containing protein [Roseburia sp.]MCM1556823.1 PKD domain-containing protein [Anaeroplasma bactoclasticum]
MKKILILIFFFFCFNIQADASSWSFIWDETTTTIEIPLGGNLQNYISKPKAKLYRDGKLLEDAQISYITTGDWLYLLTDVDTHKVGSYQVWYKAVENKYKPGQCQGYKTLVTFNVVDLEKPIFVEYPTSLTYLIGSEKPKLEERITVIDNSGNCKLTIDDSLVNYDIPGTYEIILRASDGRNIAEQSLNINVSDPIGPVITFLGENNHIILTKGEEVKLQSYFKAIDKIDGDVTASISYPYFSTDTEQNFELEVTFSDKNQNVSSIIVSVEIVDQDEITIELYKPTLILEYTTNIESALKENLKSAYLGKKDIINDVTIQSFNVKNAVGSYNVIYTYTYKDKIEKVECELKLLSNSSPILLVENVSVDLNKKVNILEHIQVHDPSDPDIVSKIEYDDSLVDYSKEGTYPVRVTVTNSSNLSSSETLYITVYASSGKSIESRGNIYMILILIGFCLAGSGIAVFIYFKKKKNCNKEQNQL